jgi:hypothetical protein
MATTVQSSQQLQRNQLGLLGVIMPGVAQVAPGIRSRPPTWAPDQPARAPDPLSPRPPDRAAVTQDTALLIATWQSSGSLPAPTTDASRTPASASRNP